MGRIFYLRCDGPMGGPPPERLADEASADGARIVLVDATHAEYADSEGLRWLLALRREADERGLCLRIAAPTGGKVWRNIKLLDAGLSLHPTVQSAWSWPCSSEDADLRGKDALRPVTIPTSRRYSLPA
jgi:Anti-anti-sigma regulatory factor (antagonist of anti-sigma factor)